MSASIEDIPIRLELNVRSRPPAAPLDINTGETPQFWRGTGVAIALGIFDCDGYSVNLSNLAYLEVDIVPMPIPNRRLTTNQTYTPYTYNPYPTTPPAPLLRCTIPAANITPTISKGGWYTGTAQNAIAIFDWYSTQQLNLGGEDSALFWLYVSGFTNSGNKLTFGGSQLEVFESGAQNIYLPNPSNFTPLSVPAQTILYIEPNQQMFFAQTIAISGLMQIEGMAIQIGAAQGGGGGGSGFSSGFGGGFGGGGSGSGNGFSPGFSGGF